MNEVPYLKRATLGNISIKTNEFVDGMSEITYNTTELIIVTANGKFNKIPASALTRSNRNKAGKRTPEHRATQVLWRRWRSQGWSLHSTERRWYRQGALSLPVLSQIGMNPVQAGTPL